MIKGHMISCAACLILTLSAVITLTATSYAGQECCGSCSDSRSAADDNDAYNGTIVDLAAEAGSFNTLISAVKAAGLAETLAGKGPFTVFAPSDEAFARIEPGILKALTRKENVEKLKTLLTYHVAGGRVSLREAFAGGRIQTLEGSDLQISFSEGRFKANKVEITDNDLLAANGVIHVIDEVLVPEGFVFPDPITSSARDLIMIAISRGVPLFNGGQPEACAAIYEITAQALLTGSRDELSDDAIAELESVLDRAATEDDPVMNAWMLRHALDNAYLSLPQSAEKTSPKTQTLLIDDFSEPSGLSDIGTNWRLFTDRVMGGISNGTSRYEQIDGKSCLRMEGNVSLENNGGFVQVALPFNADERPVDASDYRGIRLMVRGNGGPYYLHLRTAQNILPWQYFSAPVETDNTWRTLDIPFSTFTGQSTRANLDTSALKRLGVVGAKKAFQADIALARIELYRY